MSEEFDYYLKLINKAHFFYMFSSVHVNMFVFFS